MLPGTQGHWVRQGSLAVAEFVDVLNRSTLAERRPMDEPETLAGMLRHAGVIATARTEAGLLVGISRAIPDFSYLARSLRVTRLSSSRISWMTTSE